MKYTFVRDNDFHWYLVPNNMVGRFYNYVDAMENCDEYDCDFDFEKCRINNPSYYCFENPIICITSKKE